MKSLWGLVGLLAVAATLVACSRATPTPTATSSNQPPTVSAIFDTSQSAARPTATPRPTRTPAPAGADTSSARQKSQIVDLVIYDETLDPGWSADDSWGVNLNLANTSYAYASATSASVTPLQEAGAFFLAVKEGVQRSYPITEVVGVSLWLNSGADYLTPQDLAVTVLGSNDYTYWVKDDTSVQTDEEHFFSESRLMYLGITRDVPPEKWVEAVVWLNKLPYEPDYRYVTGIYVKNDANFRRTYYVDRVALLVKQPVSP